ncbi:MAG TPA: hypothetical protein VG323_11205, partial [Thermoanaerobaculia bacterium]|nr:hypothetical protein [Thermoanaerobaculia bacterium]
GTTNGTAAYLTSAVELSCGSSTVSQLCISGSRFTVTVKWLKDDGTRGNGSVVVAGPDSGVFWFFGSTNWELLVKMPPGTCPFFNRYWVFSAATTDVHYEMIVTDVKSGQEKHYFNYQGIDAPAVNDTDAFATCP